MRYARIHNVWLLIALAALAVSPSWSALPELPDGFDLSRIKRVVVQRDGRWMPLDTAARDIVIKVTGETHYNGHDPMLLFLGWVCQATQWEQARIIRVKTPQVREKLKLDANREYYSFAELVAHKPLHAMVDEANHLPSGQKPNPYHKKAQDIEAKLVALQQALHARAVTAVPDPSRAVGAWTDVTSIDMKASPVHKEARVAWAELQSAFAKKDAVMFDLAARKIETTHNRLPAAYRPPAQTIERELRYNQLRPFRTAWVITLIGVVLAVIAAFVGQRWFDHLSTGVMIGGFAVLTYGLFLRWSIAGRIPAANMFESLLFLSWGTGAFALVAIFLFKHRSVPLTAAIIGVISLALADCLPIDQFVRPIPPVLQDTIWMSIHVPIIMISYSVLAISVLVAHAQVALLAVDPRERPLTKTIDDLMYWYVYIGSFLLYVGIVTGSMWAASSWGRYWGWDPKEVWSLVALLAYLGILHIRMDRTKIPRWWLGVAAVLGAALMAYTGVKLGPLAPVSVLLLLLIGAALVFFLVSRGTFALAARAILAFWTIIMTYVGVNYVLGTGLHSYGFGAGAVAGKMMLVGAADLVFVLLCAAAYFGRLKGAPQNTATPPSKDEGAVAESSGD